MLPRRKKPTLSSAPAFRLPGPREFGILKILWRDGALSVAEIRDRLPDTPPLAYTTVMTMLDQLYRKNLVHRQKNGRAFRYSARAQPELVRRTLAITFLANFFDSDPERLVAALPSPVRPADSPREVRRRPPRPDPVDAWSREPARPLAAPPAEPEEEDDSYLL